MGDPILGPLLGVFSKTKQTPIWYNNQVNDNVNALAGYMPEDNTKLMSAWADLDKATKTRAANWASQRTTDQTALTSLLGNATAANPMADRERALSFDFGNINNLVRGGLFDNVYRRRQALDNVAMGRPSGVTTNYDKGVAATNALSSAIPLYLAALSGANNAMGTSAAARSSDFGNAMAAIGARAGTNDYGAGLEMLPATALQSIRDSQIGQQGSLAGVARSNLSGYQYDKNLAGRMSDAFNQGWDNTLDSAGKVASIAGSVMGMGGVGNIASGVMGGGGAKAQPQQNLSPAYQALMYQPASYASLSPQSSASFSPYLAGYQLPVQYPWMNR